MCIRDRCIYLRAKRVLTNSPVTTIERLTKTVPNSFATTGEALRDTITTSNAATGKALRDTIPINTSIGILLEILSSSPFPASRRSPSLQRNTYTRPHVYNILHSIIDHRCIGPRYRRAARLVSPRHFQVPIVRTHNVRRKDSYPRSASASSSASLVLGTSV
eukprot:2673884-Pyramimonas_sp.AAC.1